MGRFMYYPFDTHGLSPQTIKGYRSCLASVLSHTSNAAVVQSKTISDMITLKHLTLKTVFLLAMASAGRPSELQALVFDPQYVQSKPNGAAVTLF